MRLMMRNSLLVSMTATLVLGGAALAEKAVLRVGHAQSEKDALAELEGFKKSYSDLAGWEERKKTIREGILR